MTKLTSIDLDSEKVLRYLLIAFAVCYPFLVHPQSSAALSWALPKVVFLLVTGIVGLLVVGNKLRFKTPFVLLMTGGFLVVLGSLLVTDDAWIYSVLGDVRTDGLVYQTGLYLFGMVAFTSVRNDQRLTDVLIYALLIAAAGQSLIVAAQTAFPTFEIGGLRIDFEERLVGTLGHSGYVGGYLLPMVLLGVTMSLRDNRSRVRVMSVVLLVLIALGLGLSGNRAAFYALAPVLAVVLLMRRTLASWLVVGLVLISMIGANQVTAEVRSLVTESALDVEKNYADTRTLEIRFAIWKLGLQAVPEIPYQPWLGGGPSAFNLAIGRSFPAESLIDFHHGEYGWPPASQLVSAETVRAEDGHPRSTMFVYRFEDRAPILAAITLDRVHNILLDRMLSYGLFSVLIWLVLYLYPIFRGLRSADLGQQGLAWALLAVLIYYQVWFPVPQVEPIHLLLTAIAWARLTRSDSQAELSGNPAEILEPDRQPADT